MTERYQRRLASSMEEMQAFYDAALPRGEEAIAYLDQFDLHELPDAALHLLWLMCSLSTVSFAIDVFLQPRIPSAGNGYLPWTTELTP
jgi:hypothetical protein